MRLLAPLLLLIAFLSPGHAEDGLEGEDGWARRRKFDGDDSDGEEYRPGGFRFNDEYGDGDSEDEAAELLEAAEWRERSAKADAAEKAAAAAAAVAASIPMDEDSQLVLDMLHKPMGVAEEDPMAVAAPAPLLAHSGSFVGRGGRSAAERRRRARARVRQAVGPGPAFGEAAKSRPQSAFVLHHDETAGFTRGVLEVAS